MKAKNRHIELMTSAKAEDLQDVLAEHDKHIVDVHVKEHMKAQVNQPPHYKMGKIGTIDAIEGMNLSTDYHLANAIKYISRCRFKGTFEQDLRKAIWYLERRIKLNEETQA